MANEYATLAELKTHLRISETSDDIELQSKLTSGARRIDRDTGRRFYLDSNATARIYPVTHPTKLLVDDFGTLAGLVVETGDGNTWTTVASTAYRARPDNNLAESKAVYLIERMTGCWPVGWLARVTAKWGWPVVPDEIHDANLLASARLFRRKDSPEGVAGFNDLGVVRVARYDPDYDALIGPYVLPGFG